MYPKKCRDGKNDKNKCIRLQASKLRPRKISLPSILELEIKSSEYHQSGSNYTIVLM